MCSSDLDRIFGPGNAWVTAAKALVASEPSGASIDAPAGPSEVLVIADAGASPEFIAADLLSQAEHGEDSQVILISSSRQVAEETMWRMADCVIAMLREEMNISILHRYVGFLSTLLLKFS